MIVFSTQNNLRNDSFSYKYCFEENFYKFNIIEKMPANNIVFHK